MRRLIVAILVIGCAGVAFAGGNPAVRMTIDFDPPNRDPYITVQPYEPFEAYVALTSVQMGVGSVSFRLSDPSVDYPGSFPPPSFVNLLPGNLAIGSWDTGITVASTECVPGPSFCVGYLNLISLDGTPGCVRILDHPAYPRWVVDCGDPYGEVDFYCQDYDGHINGALCSGGDCPDSVPIESSSWGEIKRLFR